MKRLILLILSLCLLSGCKKKVEQVEDETSVDSFTGDYYRMINKGRGTNAENFYLEFSSTKDLVTIGSGLQRLSASYFSTDSYYLSEGRCLSSDDHAQLKRRDAANTKKADRQYPYTLQVAHGVTLDGVKDPIMVDNLTELDFYKKSGASYKLSGLSIAIILDPRDENNNKLDTPMSSSTIKSFSKTCVKTLCKYIKEKKSDYKKLPMLVGIYMANDNDESFVNGHYLYTAYCENMSAGSLKALNEEHVFYASSRAKELDPTTYSEFTVMRSTLKNASTEAAGLVGEASYIDEKIQSMKITANLNIKTYTELLYLTGVLADAVEDGFTTDFSMRVLVYSQDELMAIIVKNKGEKANTTILES